MEQKDAETQMDLGALEVCMDGSRTIGLDLHSTCAVLLFGASAPFGVEDWENTSFV